MSHDLWQEWQDFVLSNRLSKSQLHVVLVFLCIRGLSKSKIIAKKLALSEFATPGEIIQTLLQQDLIPSVRNFDRAKSELLPSIITIHMKFNLGQFLQGENTPQDILDLGKCIVKEGEGPLTCYLYGVVGTMSGLLSPKTTKGSLFLDDVNGRSLLSGIRCLQRVTAASPHAIYWHYMSLRAQQLGIPSVSPEHLVLARLACLVRATSADVPTVAEAWASLTDSDRDILFFGSY